MFAAIGAELEVVGSGKRDFFDRLEKSVSATRFTGTVDRIEEHMAQARIAIVPERSGGGFKIKVLDYVFNRIPVVALAGSIAGTPLRNRESVLLFPNQASLAAGVVRAIDDLEQLNRLQDRAFALCRDAFDWRMRGALLAQWAGSS
jgi:polysaccharide biosynthesis protein PslH